jgi:DNA-binding beta-propeller fold protein YncE
VCISESARHRIVCFSPGGELVRTLGSFGYAPGRLNSPRGLACDDDGAVYVADRSNHRVQKLSLDSGECLATVGKRGPPAQGCLKYPQGVALGQASTARLLFVADYGNDRVVALDSDTLEWAFDFGAGADLELPGGIAVEDDHIAVTHGAHHRVELYSSYSRELVRTFGRKGRAPGEFTQPMGVALRSGRLYVSEGEGQRLQVLSVETGAALQIVRLVGGLSGLALDALGAVVLVDHLSCTIRFMSARSKALAAAPWSQVAAQSSQVLRGTQTSDDRPEAQWNGVAARGPASAADTPSADSGSSVVGGAAYTARMDSNDPERRRSVPRHASETVSITSLEAESWADYGEHVVVEGVSGRLGHVSLV